MEKQNYHLKFERIASKHAPGIGQIIDQHSGETLIREVEAEFASKLITAYNEKYGPREFSESDFRTLFAHHEHLVKQYGNQEMIESVNTLFRALIDNRSIKYNGSHSFTEGSDPIPDPEYSIDEQLEAIRQWIDVHNYAGSPSMRVKDPGILWAIQKNLQAIKRWRESPVMHDIDCEKVIEDLVTVIKQIVYDDSDGKIRIGIRGDEEAPTSTNSAIQNAEAALGMLRALKEKRDKQPLKPSNYKLYTKEESQQSTPDEGRMEFKKVVIPNADPAMVRHHNQKVFGVDYPTEKDLLRYLCEVFNLNQAESIINAIKLLK